MLRSAAADRNNKINVLSILSNVSLKDPTFLTSSKPGNQVYGIVHIYSGSIKPFAIVYPQINLFRYHTLDTEKEEKVPCRGRLCIGRALSN